MVGGAIGLQRGGVVTNLPSGVICAIQTGGITTIDNAGYIGGVNLLSGTVAKTGTIRGDAYVGSAAYNPGGSYTKDRLLLVPTAVLGQAHIGNTVSSAACSRSPRPRCSCCRWC